MHPHIFGFVAFFFLLSHVFEFCSFMVFQRYIRYFTEKLNRRNITSDVKHFEDCERLFISIGRCFVVEALLEFF